MPRKSPARIGTVYLLHFEPRYKHAGHYLGFADDAEARFREHTTPGNTNGSPLVRAAVNAGCNVILVRIWTGVDRNFERRKKRQGSRAKLCPVCRAKRAV